MFVTSKLLENFAVTSFFGDASFLSLLAPDESTSTILTKVYSRTGKNIESQSKSVQETRHHYGH